MTKKIKTILIFYIVSLIILNVVIIAWTYPAGGYGALAAMIITPVANFICLLLFMGLLYFFKDKTIKQAPNYYLLFALIAFIFVAIVYLLVSQFYSHSGC